jgi:threonine dehydrogenase-like Zn-dependent dehydrogenase
VVLQTGKGVGRFKKGDRVACIGAGYAQHTDFTVVPHHLCVRLPENVTFAQGSYAMLAATALQALRRNEPQFGEYTAVVGMGLVGQLAARLHQLAGNYVMGWDTNPFSLKTARKWGIDATAQVGQDDDVRLCREFTNGGGLDSAVIAFGGDCTKAYETIFECLKLTPDGHHMGRVVIVGGASIEFKWATSNIDIRMAARTGAGYHDEPWETGPDYPPVFMRWTTRTNLELCIRLIAEKKLNVDGLTTHTVSLSKVDKTIDAMIDHPEKILGVVFDMKK